MKVSFDSVAKTLECCCDLCDEVGEIIVAKVQHVKADRYCKQHARELRNGLDGALTDQRLEPWRNPPAKISDVADELEPDSSEPIKIQESTSSTVTGSLEAVDVDVAAAGVNRAVHRTVKGGRVGNSGSEFISSLHV